MAKKLSNKVRRKFIEEIDVNDYEIMTDSGWEDISSTKKTIVYDIYKVVLENGHFIECADTHILIKSNNEEIYAKDSINSIIKTVDGDSKVIKVIPTPFSENMYDLTVSSDSHLYYCNGVLSHNSIGSIAYIMHLIMFSPDKKVAILANKFDTAKEMLARIKLMLEDIPFFLQPGCKELNKHSILFSNNSEVTASGTSSASIRGKTISLLYLDEFAWVDNSTEFYTSTYPVITAGTETKVIVTSTANGMGNMFYQLWLGAMSKTSAYIPFEVIWRDVPALPDGKDFNDYRDKKGEIDWKKVPMRDDKWKKEYISNTSEVQWEQEMENAFINTGDTLISGKTLLRLQIKPPVSVRDGVKIYDERREGHNYVMCVDVSQGIGGDFSTFNIIDVTHKPFRQVAVFRDNAISPILFPHEIKKWADAYNEAYVIIESNNQGGLVTTGLHFDLEYENMHMESFTQTNKMGVDMNKKTKRIGCTGFKNVLEEGGLEIYDEDTIKEIQVFQAKGTSYEAAPGHHDDLVMNFVLFGYFVTTRFWNNATEIDFKQYLYEQKIKDIEDSKIPFGFVRTGKTNIEEDLNLVGGWYIARPDEYGND